MLSEIHNIDALVNNFLSNKKGESSILLLLLAEKSAIDFEALKIQLNAMDILFFGGIFPCVYGSSKVSENGVVHQWVEGSRPTIIENISGQRFSLDIKQFSSNAIVFIDGLTSGIDRFLSKFYNSFGTDLKMVGGGAGSISLESMPCIFDNTGLYADAAVVFLLKDGLEVGIRHGWKRAAGPFVATKTDKNVIQELNWRPALETYKEAISINYQTSFDGASFFDTAKKFPFAMVKEGAEDIVRDPITVDEAGHIVCVGTIPENSVLNIMTAEKKQLVYAAYEAASASIMHNKVAQHQFSLIIDCISRKLFLEDDFFEELKMIDKAFEAFGIEEDFIGAMTLGEIGAVGSGFPQFFNKTVVVGGIYD